MTGLQRREATIVIGIDVVGIKLQGMVELLNRLGVTTLSDEQQPAIVEGVRIVGVEFRG